MSATDCPVCHEQRARRNAALKQRVTDTTVATVTTVTRPMATCTCGWRQLHESYENAQRDAELHQREQHER